MNNRLLEIRNLEIDGESDEVWHEIIKDLDLDLDRGEVLGLIGESGAGKSTLGLAAMNFVRPGCRIRGGTIRFDGQELTAQSETTLRKLRGVRIAYVAQSAAASFNPAHQLIDQFSEIPVVHNVKNRQDAEADAKGLYRRVLLPDPDAIGYRYPHQVSGGQLQRAMTAMALSCRPDLIIFDEPTTALDVTTQIEVLTTIRDIVREFNTAAIYISHDLAVVAQMADRIMVLRYGELVEEATTREMMSDPKMDYTKSLWAVRSFKKETETAATEINPVVKVDNVTAGYAQEDILKNVTFEIHRGQTVAIVGESGSGKSTAARVITGLLPPRLGNIQFNGQVLPKSFKARNKDQLRHVQMIYQMADTALNPRQRIRNIIGRPLSFYLNLTGQKREERIRELLSLIELEPDLYIDRFPDELSGGQKQRVSIARALAAEPEFIICDEVTSALDQLVAEGILRLLDRLQREFNLAYMFITHDLATVRAIADNVVVMLQGEIVEQGPKTDVFSPPHHEYTELLLSSVPEMDPDWLNELITHREKHGVMASTSTS
ncbi:MAG: ABC transporter [Acidiferrobacteraceae bacterium]|jgi:peptide/nickel transport system ATP-binding protein|nr:ABC transporter [Acidiferrobacteraceae bacterium]MDP6398836.1 ABC transporter ATP-binding protein [Arenicellales bacterium]MDP6550610.1 ABC transporter ATP-binding protein [Arenicellales bacterium]MDP6791525.1 ABC transporter ATP-binding protein [Arenicellales bacterium]MDP6918426.1 ABC transporter ATP-binding protein [Arenicellales bacterium]|tara:strand:+ start:5290 stop:6930 length:1641 start_codon:yes stop_codon:yes gene_type:complete